MGVQFEILRELHADALAELGKGPSVDLTEYEGQLWRSYMRGIVDGIEQVRKALMLPDELPLQTWEGAHI